MMLGAGRERVRRERVRRERVRGGGAERVGGRGRALRRRVLCARHAAAAGPPAAAAAAAAAARRAVEQSVCWRDLRLLEPLQLRPVPREQMRPPMEGSGKVQGRFREEQVPREQMRPPM